MRVPRRQFLKLMAGATAALACPAPIRATARRRRARRCIVLGIDGMDPALSARYMREGLLPNFSRLAASGHFAPLRTSMPPQSPVAWSNFISGANPGTHGIFDFIARDPATLTPYLSTSRMLPGSRNLRLGPWSFPLNGGRLENLRRGKTLWVELEKRGVDSTVIRIPANFPPVPSGARTLSGLGTPDIHGAYGIFTLFTDRIGERSRDLSGGRVERIRVRDNRIAARLPGPVNTFDTRGAHVDIPFTIALDPVLPSARIRIQSHDFILGEGGWSAWIPLRFQMVPHLAGANGICRFYLRRARDAFELYVAPVNIDPANPVLSISSPDDFSASLARRVGRFYTQGMAEDTSALSAGALSDTEFRAQSTYVLRESQRLYASELPRFREGLFFFYFSCLDQNSHAFWRTVDPGHPLHDAALTAMHGDFLPWLYTEMDKALGQALEACDDETLLFAMSDHGFGSFRRQFNLNTWLLDNGYARLQSGADREADYFGAIRWGETQAYGLGINSLYLNLAGREPEGCVQAAAKRALQEQIRTRLLAAVDPETGERPIHGVYRPEEIYTGTETARAPDLIIGYAPNYRASWDTILGRYPSQVYLDNRDPWSGDHCIDAAFMSGVIFSNQRLASEAPALEDLASVITRWLTA
jgi:predicted AlkP superfamily phosphohydrolase/phosphomutase